MEQIIQKMLEMDPPVAFLAIMFLVFIPSSCVLIVKQLNRWVKTIVVLVSGEVGAIALFVLAQAAKDANTGNILAEFTPLAIVLAVITLVSSIVGHIFHWDKQRMKDIARR